jgi:serine/threonine protein kinase
LGKHSQIPQLLAFFEEKRQFSLVQEFVAGHAMDKELTSGVRLKQTKVVEILKEVLQVLAFIHSYGVIHRDIKPSNLIRRESDGRIVLIDFGAVKQIHPQQVENHTISIGTPSYAPSEQMSGLPKLNSDIYALGIMGIQALTGVDPRVFRRDTNTGEIIIQTEPDGNTDVWHSWRDLAEVTNELVVILNKMAHFDFTQRYQSAAEVLKVLESI